ncbi:MAG: efflux RND transporter periplasmic adaptor subunit [Chlorobi bacterium]|nr:efflux RND transporter periplasmic adaptor subunit [Chlorobiota bacterium]
MKRQIINLITVAAISGLFAACSSSGKESHEKALNKETVPENVVSLTPQQIKAIDLKLGKIEKHNISTTVKSNGRTQLLPQYKANVSTLVAGVVKNVFVIEGDFVKKGQLLAILEHPDIVNMQQQYLENVNNLEFLEQDYQRKKELYEEKVGSGKDYQKALSEYNRAKSTAIGLKAKLQMLGISIKSVEKGNITSTINITSPIRGYVRSVGVNIGSFMEPNSDLFEIVDNSKIHADLLVYEKDIPKVKTGQEVHFNISNIPGRELKGTIFSVGKAYEDEAKAITVHATIENAGGNIIPGMYVNAHIIVDSITTDVLPEEAIAAEGNMYFIFIKTEGEKHTEGEENEHGHDEKERWYFKKTEVITGIRDGGFVEIKLLKPLPENAGIAVNAAYYLLAEMGKGETEHEH